MLFLFFYGNKMNIYKLKRIVLACFVFNNPFFKAPMFRFSKIVTESTVLTSKMLFNYYITVKFHVFTLSVRLILNKFQKLLHKNCLYQILNCRSALEAHIAHNQWMLNTYLMLQKAGRKLYYSHNGNFLFHPRYEA